MYKKNREKIEIKKKYIPTIRKRLGKINVSSKKNEETLLQITRPYKIGTNASAVASNIKHPYISIPSLGLLTKEEQKIITILWHYQPFKEKKLRQLFKDINLTNYQYMLEELENNGYILAIDNYLYLTEKGVLIGYKTRHISQIENILDKILDENISTIRYMPDPRINVTPINPDTTQPSIVYQKPIIKIPKVDLDSNIKLEIISIDTIKPMATTLQPRPLKLPQMPPIDNPVSIATQNIDTKLFNKYKSQPENLEKISDLKPIAAEKENMSEELTPSSQIEESHEEVINIIQTIANLEAEGPIIIVVDRKYGIEDLVADTASLLLRIKKQGLPEVYSETTFDDVRNLAEKAKKLQIREDLAEELEQEKPHRIINLLREWWLENRTRIIILPTENAEAVYAQLKMPLLAKYVAQSLLVRGRWDEKQVYWLSALYGFIYPPKIIFKQGRNDLYYQLAPMLKNQLKITIKHIIGRLKEKVEPEYWPQPAPEEQEESPDHYQLKWVILDHLMLQGMRPSQITYEQELKEMSGIIPDIYVKDKKLAIEIETLYGTVYPEIKINNKIQKYKDSAIDLWIVIPNMQALMYAKQLLRLEKHYRAKGQKITIYTLDLKGIGNRTTGAKTQKSRLIQLQDILQAYKKTSRTNS